jgi:hypothetical protein
LSVNGKASPVLSNQNAQGMNELVLSLPKADKPSKSYLCVDAISVSRDKLPPVVKR